MSLGRRFVPHNVAEDLVQDIFAMYWEQRESVEVNVLQSYLYKSLQNKCLNYIKHQEVQENYSAHQKIAQARLEYINANVEENSILKQISAEEFKQQLNIELSKLSPRVAEAFRLCFFEDMEHKEVAEAMGISVRTAETHIHQAVLSLRKNIKLQHLLHLVFVLTYINQ